MKSNLFKIISLCYCCLSLVFGSFNLVANNNPVTIEDIPEEVNTIFKTLNKAELLEVTIHTALDSLTLLKKTTKIFPATFSYTEMNGLPIQRKIVVSPRGKSRRKVCGFPPLKIKFCKKELAADGISQYHKSLKLVTHCSEDLDALQNVLEEYLAYKVYNELSENSLKVQLIKIKYQDTNSEVSFEKYGVLIEDIDELADRLAGEEVEGFGKELTAFENTDMNTFAMFQYMIGNEDWRVAYMRNIKFVKPKRSTKLIPIPYDFDASGLVSATYAKPDRDLKLQSVQQRAFMGNFTNKSERAETVALFNNRKTAIYQMIEDFELMNGANKARIIAYFDSFYEIINTPKLLKIAMPLKGRTATPSDIDGSFTNME